MSVTFLVYHRKGKFSEVQPPNHYKEAYMKRQISNTLGWTFILFILMAAIKYFQGGEDWLVQTIMWVVPSGMGYFLGYGRSMKDEKRFR